MVSLETEGALVTLRYLPPYDAGDERSYLDALGAIGRRQETFALMTVFGGGGHLSRAAEREQALWFKGTRGHIQRYCRAIAIVRPDANEKMAETFRKLWSMPILATDDVDVARSFLQQHMSPA